MPNNIPVQASPVMYENYVRADITQQQGFGSVTTMIEPFFTSFVFPMTSSVGAASIYGTTTSGTASIEISDYNNHAFQFAVTGSGQLTASVQSSLDGYFWEPVVAPLLLSAATSSVVRVTGRRRYFQVIAQVTGSKPTASVYMISGQ